MGNNVIKDRRPPKVYRIERDETTGTVIVHVGIKWPAGPSWRLLSHCNLHSPTGFEIGYGGSGPADTASSILADYLGEDLVGLNARGEAGPSAARQSPSNYIMHSSAT